MGWLAGSSVRLGNPGGAALSALIILGMLVLISLGVRQALRLPHPTRRLWLAALRVLTGLVALLFALQPQWVAERVTNVQGRLAVLVDASRSMSVRDVLPSRAQRALELLRSRRRDTGSDAGSARCGRARA
jgi:hypothetical protein